MRPDMAKILVERPRSGGGRTRGVGRPPRDPDLLRAKVTGHRIAIEARSQKWFGENLAPLRRYIERQEGRPWNKVFSEMREHIRPGNTVQEHVFAHLDNYLIREVDKVAPSAGAPCGLAPAAGQPSWRRGVIEEGQLYVDPDDGLLKRARRKLKGPSHRRALPGEAPVRLNHHDWAVPVNGVWKRACIHDYTLYRAQMSAAQAEAFIVGGKRHEVWRDPFDGDIRPWEKGKLAVLAERYGPGRLISHLSSVSLRQRRTHHLVDVRR